MKTLKNILIVIFIAFLGSCERSNITEKEKKVLCTQTSDYAYLDYLPKTPSICDTGLCKQYQQIWKEIFMEKNGITDDYFNKHIELMESDIDEWNDGTSFNISYYIKYDWAIAYNIDQFIIKIKKDNTTYPALNVSRGEYLTKSEILRVVNFAGYGAFSSSILKLPPDEKLKFDSMNDALHFLAGKANVNTLCLSRIYIDYKNTGQLILEADAQYENEINRCIFAKLELITGETTIEDGSCWIN